jgi:hypothetical protein
MEVESIYINDLHLSLLRPLNSEVITENEGLVRIYLPRPDINLNHRPSISFKLYSNNNESIENVWESSRNQIKNSYNLFSLLNETNVNINNEFKGVLMEYSWYSDELSMHFWSLQSLLSTRQGYCYLINAAVELTHFNNTKTIFFETVKSLRYIS